MSLLIFSSVDISGLTFNMAEILNRHGVETYHVCLAKKKPDLDSTEFHYGIKSVDWDLSHLFNNKALLHGKTVKNLKQIKEKYNISGCLATGAKAYLLKQAGISYKYWCYGSDLNLTCFKIVWQPNYHSFWEKCLLYPNFFIRTRPLQRKSICQASSVMISKYQMENYDKICHDKKFFFIPHFLDVNDYNPLMAKKSRNNSKLCQEMKSRRLFFSSVRHEWSGYLKNKPANKGNDILLNAFAKYIKITKDYDTKLVLVDKGSDVGSSKLLLQELGIVEYVVWVGQMRREELSAYYQAATMCFGQFGTPVLEASAVEPLANATVCVSYFEDDNAEIPFYKEMPPIFNSKNADEISDFMYGIMTDANRCAEISYKSWLWAKEYCSEEKFVESFSKTFGMTNY